MLITSTLSIDDAEIQLSFIRSTGPGGQNVNKVASAVQLRFNVANSPSLPVIVKNRLYLLMGNRITTQGELIIKASCFRTQERNKMDALNRLKAIILAAATIPKKRKKTKPTFSSTQKRLNTKKLHSKNKSLRRNTSSD